MIDYQRQLLGKTIHVFTNDTIHEGIFEGMQVLGPDGQGSLFAVLKMDEDRTIFIPESLVERIELVGEPSIFGEDGERPGNVGTSESTD